MNSTLQTGALQDLARMSEPVVDGAFSILATGSLVLGCLLITPFFLGAHYWSCLRKLGQQTLNLKG